MFRTADCPDPSSVGSVVYPVTLSNESGEKVRVEMGRASYKDMMARIKRSKKPGAAPLDLDFDRDYGAVVK